jgi:hypothetical protein
MPLGVFAKRPQQLSHLTIDARCLFRRSLDQPCPFFIVGFSLSMTQKIRRLQDRFERIAQVMRQGAKTGDVFLDL